MFVKTGFTLDYGKIKFDVGVDEIDLARILTEAGIPPDSQLTALEAFQVLRSEAEMLCAAQRAQVDTSDDFRAQVRTCREQQAAHLGKITARLGLEPDGQ